jgi:hypothetical protein
LWYERIVEGGCITSGAVNFKDGISTLMVKTNAFVKAEPIAAAISA